VDKIIESFFVGAGLFIGILLVAARFRDTFLPKNGKNANEIRDDLKLIRDEYRDLIKLQREYIDDLRDEITDTGRKRTKPLDDNTRLDK
jgi:hypothetical protein